MPFNTLFKNSPVGRGHPSHTPHPWRLRRLDSLAPSALDLASPTFFLASLVILDTAVIIHSRQDGIDARL